MIGDYSMLNCIPALISEVQNEDLVKVPKLDEVKRFFFIMNGDSACGLDGFSGVFNQQCRDIIGEDVTKLVKSFFCGFTLPRFITHINLVLIPKKEC